MDKDISERGFDVQQSVTDDEILLYLNIPSDSEDEFLSDSESFTDGEPTEAELAVLDKLVNDTLAVDNNTDNEPSGVVFSVEQADDEVSSNRFFADVLPGPSTSQTCQKKSNKPLKYDNVCWEKRHLNVPDDELIFKYDTKLSDDILKIETPLQFFLYLFTDDLIDHICAEMLKYSLYKDVSKPFTITNNELKKFLGICVMMSIVHVPNVRKYWSNNLQNPVIKGSMPVNMFEKIRQHLHFNDSNNFKEKGQLGHDRLFRIRPVYETLRARFKSIPLEQSLSIDEQICPTKVRHYLKQYMPSKPYKWGYKLFFLCGASGYAYDFEIYGGDEHCELLDNEQDLGASANVVIRLSRAIPDNCNYRLYFDNYYTSLPLMVTLKKRGIFALGTLRRNRVKGLQLPTESEMKKQPRGFMDECCATVDGVDTSAVVWKDNKSVTLLSTLTGINPVGKVKRYIRKDKVIQEVDCPDVVKVYNKHMGGVDLLDSFLGRYRNKMKSRKWYMKIFYHLVDITVINAWLLYKRKLIQQGSEVTALSLPDFREELGVGLCTVGLPVVAKRGRPSSEVEGLLAAKLKRSKHINPLPVKDARIDQISHWPHWMEKRSRCKFPNCKGYTFVLCQKCKAALCFNKDKNCFYKFHQ